MHAFLAQPEDMEPEDVEPEDVEPEDVEPSERPAVDRVVPVDIAPVSPQSEAIYVVDATNVLEFTLNLVETDNREVKPVKPVFKTEVTLSDDKWLTSFRLPTKV